MPNDSTVYAAGRAELRALRRLLRSLEKPLDGFLRPFEQAEREAARLEVDLALLDAAPFGAVILPAAVQREEPATGPAAHPAVRTSAGWQASASAESAPARASADLSAPERGLSPAAASGAPDTPQPDAPRFTLRPAQSKAGPAQTAAPPTRPHAAMPLSDRSSASASNGPAAAYSSAAAESLRRSPGESVPPLAARAAAPVPGAPAVEEAANAGPPAHATIPSSDGAVMPALLPALARIDALATRLLAQTHRAPVTPGVEPVPQSRTAIGMEDGAVAPVRQTAVQAPVGAAGRSRSPAALRPDGGTMQRRSLPEQPSAPRVDAYALAQLVNEILVEEALRHGVDLV